MRSQNDSARFGALGAFPQDAEHDFPTMGTYYDGGLQFLFILEPGDLQNPD